MPLARCLRPERGKLRLPKPQHVRFDARQTAHFADAEIELIRNLRAMIVNRRLNHTGTFYQNFLTLVATKRHRPKAEKDHRGSHGDSHRGAPRLLCGIHPGHEGLLAGSTLDRLLIARGAGGPRLQEIIDLARQRSVAVRFEPREALDRAANGAAHQGVVAFGSAHQYSELEDVAKDA